MIPAPAARPPARPAVPARRTIRARRTIPARPRADRDAGNAALELVILAPIIVLLICMVIASGRTSVAQGSVDAAARDAARQASISRTPQAAIAAALASAQAELSGENLNCTPVILLPGIYRAFSAPLGTTASVTAQVSCTVSLSDLIVPGLPGSRTLRGSYTSPLDPFRGRNP
jgi:Flp pilus assembly protein TadG